MYKLSYVKYKSETQQMLSLYAMLFACCFKVLIDIILTKSNVISFLIHNFPRWANEASQLQPLQSIPTSLGFTDYDKHRNLCCGMFPQPTDVESQRNKKSVKNFSSIKRDHRYKLDDFLSV